MNRGGYIYIYIFGDAYSNRVVGLFVGHARTKINDWLIPTPLKVSISSTGSVSPVPSNVKEVLWPLALFQQNIHI